MKLGAIICLFFTMLFCAGIKVQAQIAAMDDANFTAYLKTIAPPAKAIDYTQKLPIHYTKSDLQILRRVLEEAHTPIYRYTSKAHIDSLFEEALTAANDSMTYLQFISTVSRIQNAIACGHSGWSHTKEYLDYRNNTVGLFPLDIKIINDHIYVLKNNSEENNIPLHSDIAAINHMPADSIIKALRHYTYRDGTSTDSTTYDIEQHFTMMYSNFIDNPQEFHVIIKNNRNKLAHYKIEPLLKRKIDSIRAARYPSVNSTIGTPLRFEIVDSVNTGIYTIKWFNKEYIQAQGQDFEKFTDSVFTVLSQKNISNLVIDLRDNSGGWTQYGKYLFSYFIDSAIPYIKSVETKKYQNFSFAPLIIFEAGYSDTFNLALLPNGRYTWQNNPNLIATPQKQNRYKGNIYILTNAGTRSCSSIFCSLMKEHTDAIFAGKATGTAQNGTGGMVMAVRLPYTGLPVYFTTATYTCAVTDTLSIKGVEPDIKIAPDIQSLQKGEDVAKTRTLSLIKK